MKTLYVVCDENARTITIAAFLLGTIVILLYRPFSQLEVGDSAIYDYIAQSILRGQVPYRDVADVKGPGSVYLSAFAMAVGKLVGLRDVIAVRLFQALLVGLLSAITFQVARIYLRNSIAAVIAFLFALTSYKFAEWMLVGTQPKLPMILFGMTSVLLIAKDRPFWAGVSSMLSCLCWQPGLMFTGVAFLIFSRYLTTWRDGRALRVVIGAALPLAVVIAYFYSRGALDDLWGWTIAYNYSVFMPEAQRAPLHQLTHLWKVTNRVLGPDIVLVLAGVAGFFIFGYQRIRAALNRVNGIERFKDAILIPPLVYFAFCIINMQAGPDLIPFIPFIGIFAGLTIVEIGKLIGRLDPARNWDSWIPSLAIMVMLAVALGSGLAYRTAPGFTLQDQDRQFKAIADLLGPNDKLYVQGTVELLVLLNRPNLNPYVLLNRGVDSYAAARRATDFSVLIDEMESERPKLVALARLNTVQSRDLLQRWVNEHYDKLEWFTYSDVYVRRAP